METWNYKPQTEVYGMQNDWNQTLVAMLNEIASGGEMYPPVAIQASEKFKPLFESLLYYNQLNQSISDKYIVTFIDDDDDIISVGDIELGIVNYK